MIFFSEDPSVTKIVVEFIATYALVFIAANEPEINSVQVPHSSFLP